MFEMLKNLLQGGLMARYQVESTVIRHQFFTIATARDKKTMRSVLFKTYTDEGMDVQAKLDATYRERPLSELLPEIVNRFIVRTIEVGKVKGRTVEVLEAGPTMTLREALDGKRLSTKAMKRVVMQVGEGLMYLHSRGLIHRGLSPEGIVVTDEGDAKIIDMSLVMDHSRTMHSGTMVGPHGYVGPEVIRRGPVDARSDVYSLGAICYEMLCGLLPFPRANGYEGLIKIINSRPVVLSERNDAVTPEMNKAVMKALERMPEDRYASVEEMLMKFAAAPLPKTVHPRTPAFAAA